MTIKIDNITANFIGDFKVGDNLKYNIKILKNLLECNEYNKFNKCIILQTGSIVEAAMQQIIYRAQNFYNEGVKNISEDDRSQIEGKKIDKFSSIIAIFKKYKLLDTLESEIYEELQLLRKYRNKIHIQDKHQSIDIDESVAFKRSNVKKFVNLCHKIIKFLNNTYPRPNSIERYVGILETPYIE